VTDARIVVVLLAVRGPDINVINPETHTLTPTHWHPGTRVHAQRYHDTKHLLPLPLSIL
jgi:hypothetical protein